MEYKKIRLATWERVFRVLGGGFVMLSTLILSLSTAFIPIYEAINKPSSAPISADDWSINLGFLIGGLIGVVCSFYLFQYAKAGVRGYHLEAIEPVPQPRDPSAVTSLLGKWAGFAVFAAGSIGIWYYGLTRANFPDGWEDWILLPGGVFFSLFAVVQFISIVKNWNNGDEEAAFEKTILYLIATPFILIGLFIGISAISDMSSWFNSIPSWAAVIIILLVILVFSKK